MPTLTSAPIVGGAGRPAIGRVSVTPTQPFNGSSSRVEQLPQAGIVRDGQFYDAAGAGPLQIPATPEGIGLTITLHLRDGAGDRNTAVITRTVHVPDQGEVDWGSLIDLTPAPPPGPVVPGTGFGMGPFGTTPFGT